MIDGYVVVSFSGGKDSTAMLLHMMELGEKIDEVITMDTGMEFPEMYDHISRVREIVESNGIKFTVLRSELSFEYYMFEKLVVSKEYPDTYGYGWPGPKTRWCTRHLKLDLKDKYFRQMRDQHPRVIECIGLAADETKRLERPHNKQENHRHPLVEWGWTEADALTYCYDRGFDWGGLYKIFKRVSCWCCPMSSLNQLRNLYTLYPKLWEKLQEWDNKLKNDTVRHPKREFTTTWTIPGLTSRFEREERAKRYQTKLELWGKAR